MSISGRLAVLALRPLAVGTLDSLGLSAGEPAVAPTAEFLTASFVDAGSALADALRKSMEWAWKAVEVALRGGAWIRKISADADDKLLADQLGKLVTESEAPLAMRESQRRLALPELAAARRKNYLNMPAAPGDGMAAALAGGVALYTRFDDFELLEQADRS